MMCALYRRRRRDHQNVKYETVNAIVAEIHWRSSLMGMRERDVNILTGSFHRAFCCSTVGI